AVEVALEAAIMVAGDHDLVAMRLCGQKPAPGAGFFVAAADAAVAGVDQHVAGRHDDVVETVCVADEHEPGVLGHDRGSTSIIPATWPRSTRPRSCSRWCRRAPLVVHACSRAA